MEKSNPLTEEQRAEIRRAWDGVDAASHRLTVTNTRTPGQLLYALSRAAKDVPALLAEVERLENANRGMTTVTGTVIEERDTLAEQVKRVREMHVPHDCGDPDCDQTGDCDVCEEPSPCHTVRALDGSEAGR